MKRLSIILPIYNVEKFLRICVQSIVEQTDFENYEVLLVDDGSTDGSGRICDEFAGRYSNITAYHKENGGVSSARNYGLQRAVSEYVMFVDPDDCIKCDILQTLLEASYTSHCDVLLADAVYMDEDGRYVRNRIPDLRHVGMLPDKLYTGEDAVRAQLQGGMLQITVWSGIYRRKFLTDNDLWFDEGIIHEDELWTPKMLLLARSVIYKDTKFYCYRIRSNSIMRKEDKDYTVNIESLLYVYDINEKLYASVKDPMLQKILRDDLAKRYLHSIGYWNFADYPGFLKRVDRKRIWKNAASFRNRIRALLFWISPRLYCRLMHGIKSRQETE